MSRITRTGSQEIRPTWIYPKETTDAIQRLEMLESIRNAIEQLNLTCQLVRQEIAGLRSCGSSAKLLRDVDIIRRNTTKKRRTKKVEVSQ